MLESFLDRNSIAFEKLPYVEGPDNPQRIKGDYVIGGKNIELKAERSDKYGNLFLELWSNFPITRGWVAKLGERHLIVYMFIEQRTAYMIDAHRLSSWLENHKSNYFPKHQRKYQQHNDTVGICVPIADLQAAGVITSSTKL